VDSVNYDCLLPFANKLGLYWVVWEKYDNEDSLNTGHGTGDPEGITPLVCRSNEADAVADGAYE
jgi:hypothetical protein